MKCLKRVSYVLVKINTQVSGMTIPNIIISTYELNFILYQLNVRKCRKKINNLSLYYMNFKEDEIKKNEMQKAFNINSNISVSLLIKYQLFS